MVILGETMTSSGMQGRGSHVPSRASKCIDSHFELTVRHLAGDQVNAYTVASVQRTVS